MKTTYCPCSGSNHKVAECPIFIQKPREQRMDVVKKHRLCFACLKGGQECKNCFRRIPCKECTGKHSTLLHVTRKPVQDNLVRIHLMTNRKRMKSKHDQETARCGFTTTEGSVAALPILPIKIRRKGTKEYIGTYALLNGGSNTTFCTNSLSERLGYIGKERTVKLTTIGTAKTLLRSYLMIWRYLIWTKT